MIARFRFPVLLLGLLLAYPAPVPAAGELEKSRRELAEIERRIARASEELSSKQAAAGTLNEDLRRVEGELSGIQERIARLRAREESLGREMAEEQREADRAKEAIAVREAQVRKRLVALYKRGDTGLLRILFAPEAPAVRAEQYDFMGRIVRRDRELLASYRQEVAAHEEALARIEELRREQRTLIDDLQGERQVLERAGRLKSELLVRLRRDERALGARLQELRQGAERLAELIKKLESAQTGEYTQSTGAFADRKGELPWPAAGKLIRGYGRHRHPELGTLVDSQGYEIVVADEEPVVAVWPGRVIFANTFPGYGNLLIVDHGEGYYTLYAKGARLAKRVGDPVAAGEAVAFSGHGKGQSIYFEIRHRGTPLDPGGWLVPR